MVTFRRPLQKMSFFSHPIFGRRWPLLPNTYSVRVIPGRPGKRLSQARDVCLQLWPCQRSGDCSTAAVNGREHLPPAVAIGNVESLSLLERTQQPVA
jgi:hypothetical protein